MYYQFRIQNYCVLKSAQTADILFRKCTASQLSLSSGLVYVYNG